MNHPLVVPVLDRQRVLGALKSTGSTDPDVLYAKKEDLLAETKGKRMYGLPLMILGIVMTVLLITAPVGIPATLFGWWMKRRIARNNEVAESAYAEYVKSVGGKLRQVV